MMETVLQCLRLPMAPNIFFQEGISSPSMSARILDFCDGGDLFRGTSSCAGAAASGGPGFCFYHDDTSLFPSDLSPYVPSVVDASALSTLLDLELPSNPDPDMALTANYQRSQLWPPPATTAFPVPAYLSNTQDTTLDQVGLPDMAAIDGCTCSSYPSGSLVPLSAAAAPGSPPPAPPSLPTVFDDECISTLSSYMGLEPEPSSTSTCSFVMDPTRLGGAGAFYPGTFGVSAVPEEGLGFFPAGSGMAAGPEAGMFQAPEVMVEYRGESSGRAGGGGVGMYGLDNTGHHPRIYGGPGDLQALGDHQQQLANGCGSPSPLASDCMPAPPEESTFKVGRLSVEERKERIHRYMKKRNERNFSKKIKYACRKTLADSRPRVRGRFAKNNDEFGEPTRPSSGHHEDEDEEEEPPSFSGFSTLWKAKVGRPSSMELWKGMDR